MKVSQLVDRVLKGKYPSCLKYKGCLYYPDEENKTFVNIYGVTLWSVLISEVENGTPVSDLELEVIEWK